MAKQPWFKWYPSDWRSDPALRMCSLAARGLWIEMLGLMHEAEPYGHLLVKGKRPTDAQLAVLVGTTPEQIPELIDELEAAEVFSRTRNHVIYSRRMTEDAKKARLARKNGRQGGNPSLRKQTKNQASDNPRDKQRDKLTHARVPDARGQMPEGSVESKDSTGAERRVSAGEKADLDAALYDRGREILGKNAGGLVTRLKQHHGGSVPKARAVIEQAAEKSDPTEYVNAVLQKRRTDQPKLSDVLN